MRLVIFDCDGTLVDSQGIIHESMCRTFDDVRHPVPDRTETRTVIGLSLPYAIAQLMGIEAGKKTEQLAENYKVHYQDALREGGFNSPLFPGIAELIADLGDRDNVLLAMATGKSRRGVASVVAEHGWDNMFFAVRTADDCPSKPHPAMVLECCAEAGLEAEDAIVVGDTTFDMEMSRAANTTAIGVSWGYHAANLLSAAGAHHIVTNPMDIAKLV